MPAEIALIRSTLFREHATGMHPERAQRLVAIDALLDTCIWLADPAFVVQSQPTAATIADVARVHSENYLRRLQQAASRGGGMLDMDTRISSRSFEVAMHAAGAAIQIVDAVLDGLAHSGMALVRPPGHHARPDTQMGFCLINNVAVAARHALDTRGLQRVAIVDFDVHHGNGTQEMLEDDPRILFCSLHQYPCYPGTGAIGETGISGNVLNIPLPAYCNDDAYRSAFEQVLLPKLRGFKPELLLVSAGYDAHWTNSRYVAGVAMQVTVRGFAWMVQALRDCAAEICSGKLGLVLEGGYDLDALAASVLATLEVLRGQAWDAESIKDPLGTAASASTGRQPDITQLIARLRSIHELP